MTRKDYIEKINQNLKHLTKDELKDVSILTTAQYGVRLKVAEKEYIEKEIANLTPQLQQQTLPVVPECVAEWIEILKTKGLKPLKNPETYGETGFTEEKLQNIVFWISEHQEDYMRAWLDGYTVEKPQLFYLKNKLTTSYLALDINTGYYEHWGEEIIPKLPKKQGYKLSFTQQEIDSMQTGSYEQIKVEDGE
ncbi:DUF1642 domain-containing protein [Lactococcus lactis]|uniref:DUF1642 domain-containing protein n=1 Tax=Lactococcus lactis TaxID=1358 RepID=A0A6M0M7A0_9LACT|nr:DUF1642 domain-containing protein [Lactococcus lactis]NEX51222.1 DUF1642 domain-containing protein [Lactococcus lactis]NEX55340.1 DUF1642 domain-containing protein [Lactococcus lactis]